MSDDAPGLSWKSTAENIATLAAAAGTIVGLYALGAGFWSAAGFFFLLNINYRKVRRP